MTLEEQLAEQAKKGLLSLGLEQETAEEYAPWASLLAQFIPGVGEGVGVDNTVNAINDERYGDAAVEGGLTLLGAVPVVGDFAAAAIKGIRKAPIKAFDEAAWIKDNPRPHPDVSPKDMSPKQRKAYAAWTARKRRASRSKEDHERVNQGRRESYRAARDSETEGDAVARRATQSEYEKKWYANLDERKKEEIRKRKREKENRKSFYIHVILILVMRILMKLVLMKQDVDQ